MTKDINNRERKRKDKMLELDSKKKQKSTLYVIRVLSAFLKGKV